MALNAAQQIGPQTAASGGAPGRSTMLILRPFPVRIFLALF
jgi:hypothetical protein